MSSRPAARSFPKFPLLLSDYNWLHIVHTVRLSWFRTSDISEIYLYIIFLCSCVGPCREARVCLAFALLALFPDQAKISVQMEATL
jgi:hypothetical protein